MANQKEPTDMVPADLAVVQELGGELSGFLKGAAKFLASAIERDVKANEILVQMQMMAAPVTAADDERLQLTLKGINGEKRDNTALYQHVTSASDRFHKFFVGKRKKTDDTLARAAAIGMAHHTTFTEQARRADAIRQETDRRAAEQRAREDRERELAALEDAAVAAEAAAPDLSEKQKMFVQVYVQTGSVITATAGAGYRDKGRGEALLALPKVQQAIEALREAERIRQQADMVSTLPVAPAVIPSAPAAVTKAAGVIETERWTAELLDEPALIAAIESGTHPNIPATLIVKTINRVALNTEARGLRELINAWPGVRAKKTTGIR